VGLIFKYNFRNLFVRRVSTLMTLAGVAMVVAVFLVLMALAQGILSIGESTGDPLQAIVLQKGTNAETSSGISDEAADQAENITVLPRDEKGPVVSRDLFVVIMLPRPDGGAPANLVVRGVTERAFKIRPEVKVDGDKRPHGSDIVVARPLAKRFAHLNVGDKVHFGKRDWNVIAHFDAGGQAWESEIWADLPEIQADSHRGSTVSSLYVRLSRPEDLATLNSELEKTSETKGLKATTVREYFAGQTGTAGMLKIVGSVITFLLSLGAGLGAMNTMYAAIGNRSREIGTLRALGFGRNTILMSFLFESSLIGLAGGVLGCLIALPVNGLQTGTMNWVSFTETAFSFRITPGMLGIGLAIGGFVGAAGGFLPAFAAARRPILASLRST
jgi:putative ABC transport system permease protein